METDADRDDRSIRSCFSDGPFTTGHEYWGGHLTAGSHQNGEPGQSSISFGIEDFVRDVVESNMPAFHIEHEHGGQPTAHPYPLARHLRYFKEFMTVFDSRHDYSEHLQVFREGCQVIGFLDGDNPGPLIHGLEQPQIAHAHAMNRLIEWIRIAFSSSRYRRIPVVRRAQASENSGSIANYAVALLRYFSRLTVVRVDLGFLDAFHGFVTIDDVYAYLRKLIESMSRNPIFRHKVGYAWAIEQGRDKSYHIHLAVFFLGWEIRRDIYKSHEIGSFWSNDITSGMGTYFSCNSKQDEYVYRGVGLFHRGDEEGLANVVFALRYLTKDDGQHLRMKPCGARTYGHGLAPDEATKGGRPPRSA